jgi:branched-chain amino acid transport system ATP-binding protein
MLEVKGLTRSFGGLDAVSNLSMEVNAGEVVGLIGPNGAGKTTVFNLITGFLPPTRGQVIFLREDVTGRSPHIIARKGIVRTFQQSAFLPDLTVMENMVTLCYLHRKSGIVRAIFNTSLYAREEKQALDRVTEVLEFLDLYSVREDLSKNLPHGYQALLGMGIALCARPKLLLLDEPLSGMNSSEVTVAKALISKIRSSGTTILLVEHNMRAVMELCDRIVVLNFGHKIAEGTPDAIQKDEEVITAYLGAKRSVAKT